VFAFLLRGLILIVPLAAGIALTLLMATLLPRPHGVIATAGWWIAVVAVSIAGLFIADRALRRLLPLAALLRLSLVFPDRAPSRFALARQAGRPDELQRRLDALDAHGHSGTAEARDATLVLALIAALTAHDSRTRGHAERTRVFADMIAESLKLDAHQRDLLRWASILHDIGKLHVPPSVLNKPAALDQTERAVIDLHPSAGAELIAPLLPWLGAWGGAVAEHHERYDGTGYPRRLKGDAISLAGRIVAVADAFETMTAVRAYRKPLSVAAARRELVDSAGTHFDPRVVRAFLDISLGRLLVGVGPIAALAAIPVVGTASTVMARAPALGRPLAAAAVGLATAIAAQPAVGIHAIKGTRPQTAAILAPPPAPLPGSVPHASPAPAAPTATPPAAAALTSSRGAAPAPASSVITAGAGTTGSTPPPPPPPPTHHRITVIVTVTADPKGPGAAGSVFVQGPGGTPTVQKTVP
jgi:HD-GYP domain-containing protein (c-di-GMP phosphodiesterase class II)